MALDTSSQFSSQRYRFPNSYFQLLCVFMFTPLILMLINIWYDSETRKTIKKFVLIFIIVLLCAFIQGSCWDNLGCSIGIWIFNTDKITSFENSHIPIEEYSWITLHCLIAICFAFQLYLILNKTNICINITITNHNKIYYVIKYLVIFVYFIMLILGLYGLAIYLNDGSKYMMSWMVIGLFFVPFLMLQWIWCYKQFMKYPIYWLCLWILPGCYTWFVDRIAVSQIIWKFDYVYTCNIWIIPGIELELFLIYVFAGQLCSQPFWSQLIQNHHFKIPS